MSKTCVIYSPRYLDHDTGDFHPESSNRLTRVIKKLKDSKVFKDGICDICEPRRASQEEIELVHDKEYFLNVRKAVESGFGSLDQDTPISKGSFEAALMAAGGALKGCELIISGRSKNAFALVRPPGHHAGFRGRALGAPTAGFCIFNNIAISAKALLANYNLSRILILDLDCHHGNGTQEIFNESKKVMYVSIHQDGKTLYPGTGGVNETGLGEGAGYTVNIPLPPASCDDVHLKAFDQIVNEISKQFKPEFILVSAGFDSHWEDPVSHMGVSNEGFRQIYMKVLDLTENLCKGRLIASLEGGYGAKFAESVINVINVFSGIKSASGEDLRRSSEGTNKNADHVINELKHILNSYWSI
jgi:acetoin utilization deacetylase AcuC-like enzyme